MKISIELAFDEPAALRLLNWLAFENKLILRQMPDLPGLYETHVHYEPEKDEEWADYLNLLWKGKEDCDALAAARAGELMARGWRALSGRRGDCGWKLARDLRLRSIPAKVILRTRVEPGQSGMYHCIVKYWVGGKVCYDDPSARLGMYTGGVVTAETLRQPVIYPPDVHQFFSAR